MGLGAMGVAVLVTIIFMWIACSQGWFRGWKPWGSFAVAPFTASPAAAGPSEAGAPAPGN